MTIEPQQQTSQPQLGLSNVNLALFDPPKWGWSAGSGVVNLLTPQENIHRNGKTRAYANGSRTRRTSFGSKRTSTSSKKRGPAAQTGSVLETATIPPLGAEMPSTSGASSAPIERETKTPPDGSAITETTPSTKAAASESGHPGAEEGLATLPSISSPEAYAAITPVAAATSASVNFPNSDAKAASDSDKQRPTLENSSGPVAKPTTTTATPASSSSSGPLPDRIANAHHALVPVPKKKAFYKVKALDDDGILDMYTYHLGREGLEIVNEVEASDSAYACTAPKTKFQMMVQFPLGDEGEQWKEQIEWDLMESTTPLLFATNIAEQFGLEFGPMMDLATSIQKQLDSVRDAYPENPLSLVDAAGKERLCKVQPKVNSQIYGAVQTTDIKGGFRLQTTRVPDKQMQQHLHNSMANNKPTTSSSKLGVTTAPPPVFRVEQEYRDMVLQRLKEECREMVKANTSIRLKYNHQCHLCQSKQAHCGVFACDVPSHAMCEQHFATRLGITDLACVPSLDYCPICCLTCDCPKCKKRLNQLAIEFRKRTVAQGVKDPKDTVFEGLVLYVRHLSKISQAKATSSGGRAKSRVVSKVPAIEFPRETTGGYDLEPGKDKDYRTIFTKEGAYLLPEFPSNLFTEATSDGTVPEDGNVDHCIVCKTAGNIICCDFCPRAYHAECISKDDSLINAASSTSDSEKWECHTCLKEQIGLMGDSVTGKKIGKGDKAYIDIICAGFVDVNHCEGHVEAINIMGKILEMLNLLMDYDFGYMFAAPVDSTAIPEYSKLVKNPMDLGTISQRLADGYYAKVFAEKNNWDDVLSLVLMDIELVWHNCFTFNLEGSAVYRMAEVHARRARNIQKESIENSLSDTVKNKVQAFIAKCEKERAPIAKLSAAMAPSAPPIQVESRSKHSIAIPFTPGGKYRTVAVFDPEKSVVVKLYTTMKSACAAAYYIASLGHKSEWLPLSDHTIKKCIKQGKDDPNFTLFGYRWVFYEDLRAGQVVLNNEAISDPSKYVDWEKIRESNSIVQLIDGAATYVFLSLREALSLANIPGDIPMGELRQRLEDSPWDTWVTLAGFLWRKVKQDSPAWMIEERPSGKSQKGPAAIIKMDSITQRRLVGYDTFDAAFEDWRRIVSATTSTSMDTLSKSMFMRTYLNGQKSVDGLVWKGSVSVHQAAAIGAVATHLQTTKRERENVGSKQEAVEPSAKKQAVEKMSSTPNKDGAFEVQESLEPAS